MNLSMSLMVYIEYVQLVCMYACQSCLNKVVQNFLKILEDFAVHTLIHMCAYYMHIYYYIDKHVRVMF